MGAIGSGEGDVEEQSELSRIAYRKGAREMMKPQMFCALSLSM